MGDPHRFTVADAEAAGHHLDAVDVDRGRVDATGHRWVADCIDADDNRCWSFAVTHSTDDLQRQYLEHAAREAGVCWACSMPEVGWPHRLGCKRCWLMYHAEVHHLMPRDCPPFHAPIGANRD